MEISIVTLMLFQDELLKKYGIKYKIRNYHSLEHPAPYFLLDHEPSEEVKNFIRSYFADKGGRAEFSDDGKKFIVYKA